MFFRTNDDEHEHIGQAVETLRMGGVVLYQTTAPWHWALSCDATNEVAVQKIIAMKTLIQPLDGLVTMQDEKMLEDFIGPLPYFVRQFLYNQERAVTVIHPGASHLAPSVCHKDGSVSVRMIPSIDIAPVQMSRHVLRLLGKPIFVTSCTIGDSRTMPVVYEEIPNRITSAVDLISPLIFGIDDTLELSMVVKYDHEGHLTIVRK